MSYKYKKIPKGRKVLFFQLIEEYPSTDYWFSYFPKDLKVGDITWVSMKDKKYIKNNFIFEDNRYMGNFNPSYFKLVDGPNINSPIQVNYEIF
jgi:hypothetical protein